MSRRGTHWGAIPSLRYEYPGQPPGRHRRAVTMDAVAVVVVVEVGALVVAGWLYASTTTATARAVPSPVELLTRTIDRELEPGRFEMGISPAQQHTESSNRIHMSV